MAHKRLETMYRLLIVVFLSISSISLCVSASEKEDTIDAVTVLNEASIEFLGVSLDALTFLSQSNYKAYIPKSHLESSKKISLVNQLEKAGYIKIEEIIGLPDGQEPNEKFIRIIPTEKGATVIVSIQAVGHNK